MTDASVRDTSAQDTAEFLGERPVPRWRRYLKWVLVAVGVVLLGLLLSRCVRGEPAVEYVSEPVRQGPLTVTVSATGKLAPTNQVEVGSQISGLVTQVVADVNDRVRAGQPLALIDPEQLDDAIRQGQAQVNAQQAQVAQAQATLQEAAAQLERLREVSRLSGGRVPSGTEMQTAEAAVARARANVRATQANVAAARAQLNSSQTQRYRAIIRSPVNGVVLARQVEPGATVQASFNTVTLFVIAEDLSQMKLQVAIDEADVGQVQNGQRATFTVDAFPGRTFPARITRVDLGSNLSAKSSTATTTTTASTGQVVSYAAQLSVENPNMTLRPGMTATATIAVDDRQSVLMVPNGALRFKPPTEGQAAAKKGGFGMRMGDDREQEKVIGAGSRQTIYVLGDDNQPRPVQVVTGATDGSRTEVRGPQLKSGMKVIVGVRSADATKKGGND